MDYPWDNIYVLNLEHLEDKFKKIQNNLIKNGITKNIERFIGIYGINECPYGKEIQKTESNHDKWILIEKMNEELKSKKIIDKKVGNKYEYLRPGEIGHLLSFIKIMGDALDNNYETILLLEDDAVINDDFKKKFMKSYNNLPSDWDLVYLGVHKYHLKTSKKPKKINKYICDINGVFNVSKKRFFKKGSIYGTHAILMNKKAIKAFLKEAFPLKYASDVIMGQLYTTKKLIKSYYMCELQVEQESYKREDSLTRQF